MAESVSHFLFTTIIRISDCQMCVCVEEREEEANA